MKICPNCSSQMNDDAAFCTMCGATLANVAPTAAPETPTPAPEQAQNAGQAAPGGYTPPQGAYTPPQGGYAPPQGGYAPPQYYAPKPKHPINEFDHTLEYDEKDISENKSLAILIYLTSFVGILIAILMAKDSAYIRFHLRQGLKLLAAGAIVALATGVLCWTVIVPVVGGLALLALAVVQIICFFRVCMGQVREAPIVCKLGFLK